MFGISSLIASRMRSPQIPVGNMMKTSEDGQFPASSMTRRHWIRLMAWTTETVICLTCISSRTSA